MPTFIEEITTAIQSLRRQHEIEKSQADRLEQFMEAHSSELIDRIRSIREREAYRRADVARELVLLASEVGLLPPPAPPPMDLDERFDAPRIMRNASEELAHAIN